MKHQKHVKLEENFTCSGTEMLDSSETLSVDRHLPSGAVASRSSARYKDPLAGTDLRQARGDSAPERSRIRSSTAACIIFFFIMTANAFLLLMYVTSLREDGSASVAQNNFTEQAISADVPLPSRPTLSKSPQRPPPPSTVRSPLSLSQSSEPPGIKLPWPCSPTTTQPKASAPRLTPPFPSTLPLQPAQIPRIPTPLLPLPAQSSTIEPPTGLPYVPPAVPPTPPASDTPIPHLPLPAQPSPIGLPYVPPAVPPTPPASDTPIPHLPLPAQPSPIGLPYVPPAIPPTPPASDTPMPLLPLPAQPSPIEPLTVLTYVPPAAPPKPPASDAPMPHLPLPAPPSQLSPNPALLYFPTAPSPQSSPKLPPSSLTTAIQPPLLPAQVPLPCVPQPAQMLPVSPEFPLPSSPRLPQPAQPSPRLRPVHPLPPAQPSPPLPPVCAAVERLRSTSGALGTIEAIVRTGGTFDLPPACSATDIEQDLSSGDADSALCQTCDANSIGVPFGSRSFLLHRYHGSCDGIAYGEYNLSCIDRRRGAHLLAGRTLSFEVDLSRHGCGCNAAVYLVSTLANKNISECGDYYCDANNVCGAKCAEIDLMEANRVAFVATMHTAEDPFGDGFGIGHYVQDHAHWWRSPRPCPYGPSDTCTINTRLPFRAAYSFTSHREPFSFSATLVQGARRIHAGPIRYSNHWRNVQMRRALDAGMTLVVSNWAGVNVSTMSWLDGRCTSEEVREWGCRDPWATFHAPWACIPESDSDDEPSVCNNFMLASLSIS